MQALAKIDYQGDLTMEASYFYETMPREVKPLADRFLADVGRYLIGRFLFYKGK